MDRYQATLRDEIAALTVRREALQHALTVYEEIKPSSAGRRGQLGRAGSQTAFVLNAICEAGSQGLTTGEIYETLAKAGLSMKQATVRSLLYGRKERGILERRPNGRYRFPPSGANGAVPPNKEAPAVVAADASNESREGDPLG